MKLPLLLCSTLVLSIAGVHASSPSAISSIKPAIETPVEISRQYAAGYTKKPRKERLLYYKGKGAMGLVFGLILGPVGFVAVHLFSHNITMREKAGQGAIIWVGVGAVTALVWAAIASRESVGQLLVNIILGIFQNSQ